MKRKNFYIIFLFFLYSNAKADCFNAEGRFYQIDPDYLRAISYKESRFNPRAIGNNNDGSQDIGIMQINTNNLKWLSLHFPKISVKRLLNNPCYNIKVGAFILNENFRLYGRKWLAVGAYNAGGKNNPKRIKARYKYASAVGYYYEEIKKGNLRVPRIPIKQ